MFKIDDNVVDPDYEGQSSNESDFFFRLTLKGSQTPQEPVV